MGVRAPSAVVASILLGDEFEIRGVLDQVLDLIDGAGIGRDDDQEAAGGKGLDPLLRPVHRPRTLQPARVQQRRRLEIACSPRFDHSKPSQVHSGLKQSPCRTGGASQGPMAAGLRPVACVTLRTWLAPPRKRGTRPAELTVEAIREGAGHARA